MNILTWPGPPICYFVFMQLVINGDERNFTAATLDALIEELGMKGDRVAVELNREIVPRTNWGVTALKDGDRLEIVHFVGGGKI
jgi:thiamine biosynthesis protein ThiS